VDPRHFGTNHDPDPRIHTTDLLSSVADKMTTKNKFFFKVFCLLLFESEFTSIFKNSRNQCFSYFICLLIEGSVQIMTDPNPGGPKNPDPQHCQKPKYSYILYMIANVANKVSCYICMANRTD
jgi:hypothetical protein